MKKIIIALFTLSICLASGNIQKQMDDLMRSLQYKYQISGPEDLYKLKTQQTPQYGRTASRDMGDLVGDWRMEEENMEVFVTVGSDQSIPDYMTLMAMTEADGSITATASDYVAELTYLFDPSIMEGGDGGDCDISCEDEYNDYNDYGMEPSDIYCDCCHEDYPLDDICEDDDDDEPIFFEKVDYADVSDPANWDQITESVAITRADNQGLFNPYSESSYNELGEYGPAGTLWAPMSTEEATMLDTNVYTSWHAAMNNNPQSFIDDTVSLWCLEEDKYYDIVMASWTNGNNGGGFSYWRYPADGHEEEDDEPDFFEKEDYADVSDPANWDQITESVAITRADNQGLFNPYSESSYNELGEYGPAGTLWAPMSTEEATMLDTNVYTSWHAAMNNNPQSFIDDTVSLWCLEEDKYYDIVMASWTNGNNGGGFSYWRYPADGHEEDDDEPDLLIMNMDLMEFFMVSFGMDLDSLNIENPTVLAAGSSSDDDNIDMVMGMMFVETGVIELMADPEEAVAATSIDTLDWSITFTNLSLYDYTGTAVLTVTGTIGPGWIDFEAGVETPIDLFNEDGEGDDNMEFYVSFSEDSTGMEIEVGYDYYYYGEEYSDTSYFDWSATTDSLFLYFEGDDDYYYYYEDGADTMALGYMIIEDTLFASGSFNPCEDDGYESYEECFSDMGLPGFDELVDVESFRINQETVFTSTVLTSIEPTNGELPEEFKLYAAYPNPFNPVTTIRFDVGSTSHESTLRIYDVSGRNVATLINGQLQPGNYEVKWDARGFASGIYFSELISGTKRHTQKMVLLK